MVRGQSAQRIDRGLPFDLILSNFNTYYSIDHIDYQIAQSSLK